MAGSKGERAIKREQKHVETEKRKRIEAANKMLIPVPKATRESLGLIAFDPGGTFRFVGNRWIRVYQMRQENRMENNKPLTNILKNVTSKVRITKEAAGTILNFHEGDTFLTLTASGETYDEVRTQFAKDEEALKGQISLKELAVDDVMNLIRAGESSDFSYASMVRGKKDWKKECFSKITAESGHFFLDSNYGECCFCLQYPYELSAGALKSLRELATPVLVCMDFAAVGISENLDFNRTMEQKYNRRLGNGATDKEYMNASFHLLFTCDSDDARKIIEKTILAIFGGAGFILAPSIGTQKETAESLLSLGLFERQVMRNVPCEVLDQIRM